MIIFLYGEDTFRSKQKLKEMKKKFVQDVNPSGDSLHALDGEKCTLDEINSAVASASLFSEKRMIVVENIFLSPQKTIFSVLEKYFSEEAKDSENIIIFYEEQGETKIKNNKFFKFLKKQKFVQEFKALNNLQTANWIKEGAVAQGMKINSQAVNHLLGLFDSDLWALSNELNKIINFKKSKQAELIEGSGELEIVLADVEKLSRGKVDENFFALTDAISQKNKAKVFELFEKEIEAGVAEQYLLTMIQRQFKILLQVRQALDVGISPRQMAKELKLHPFVAQKALGQVRNYNLLSLKDIFSKLINLDAQSKSGGLDLRTGLSLLLAKI